MPKKSKNRNGPIKVIRSQADMDKAVKAINNILRRDKGKGARLYVPELTWMFFLRYLDLMEEAEAQKASALGTAFTSSLSAPYRWRDWAAPFDRKKPVTELKAAQESGWRRAQLTGDGSTLGDYLRFVNGELFPHLQRLGENGNATNKQKVIAEIFRNKERTVLASETNLLDALDRVDALTRPRSATSTSSWSRRLSKACCRVWAKRKTTAASSLPRAKSSAPSCRLSTRSWGKPSMIPAAAPAAFSSKHTSTWLLKDQPARKSTCSKPRLSGAGGRERSHSDHPGQHGLARY